MKCNKPKLLIVDDDKQLLNSLKRALRDEFIVSTACDKNTALHNSADSPDLILLDIRLEGGNDEDKSGVELLKEILGFYPRMPVVMFSAYKDFDIAIECMRLGAVDFIKKKDHISELRQRLKAILEYATVRKQAKQLEERLQRIDPVDLIGESPKIKEIKKLIRMVAEDGHVTVLISGETGTGKELVSRSIHHEGWRSRKPFVPVAMTSLNKNIVESELFGHEAGAFTGAKSRHIGFLEKAAGGVLFLDEVGDLPEEAQLKLLRFLENRTFRRAGSTKPIKIDVQVLAATNVDLPQAVREGRLREDFYYRLKYIEITLPPLRKRKEDIPDLAQYLVKVLNQQGRTRINTLSNKSIEALMNYQWPGNVRELGAVLESSAIHASFRGHQVIEKEDLPAEIKSSFTTQEFEQHSLLTTGKKFHLDFEIAKLQLKYIEQALIATNEKKKGAWKLLGMNDRFALRRRVLSIIRAYPELLDKYKIIKRLYRACPKD